MRKVRVAIAGALTVAVLAATPGIAAELTFWSWRQEDKAVYNELIADFNKTNPDTKISFETFEPQNYQTVLSTARRGREDRYRQRVAVIAHDFDICTAIEQILNDGLMARSGRQPDPWW